MDSEFVSTRKCKSLISDVLLRAQLIRGIYANNIHCKEFSMLVHISPQNANTKISDNISASIFNFFMLTRNFRPVVPILLFYLFYVLVALELKSR